MKTIKLAGFIFGILTTFYITTAEAIDIVQSGDAYYVKDKDKFGTMKNGIAKLGGDAVVSWIVDTHGNVYVKAYGDDSYVPTLSSKPSPDSQRVLEKNIKFSKGSEIQLENIKFRGTIREQGDKGKYITSEWLLSFDPEDEEGSELKKTAGISFYSRYLIVDIKNYDKATSLPYNIISSDKGIGNSKSSGLDPEVTLRQVKKTGACFYKDYPQEPVIIFQVYDDKTVKWANGRLNNYNPQFYDVEELDVNDNFDVIYIKFRGVIPNSTYNAYTNQHTWTVSKDNGEWILSRSKLKMKLKNKLTCSDYKIPVSTTTPSSTVGFDEKDPKD